MPYAIDSPADKRLKRKATTIAPIKPPEAADISFPGGYVSAVGDGKVKVVRAPPSRAKGMGGSDWSAFNRVLLETTLATISTATNNPAAASNRIAAAAASLA